MQVVHDIWTEASLQGVDISPEMLKHVANRNFTSVLVESPITSFVRGCDEQYDAIVSIGALEFVEDLPGVLPDIAHLIAPTGFLAFTYEPLIPGLPGQTDRVSVAKGSALEMGEITTHRWEAFEISEALAASSLIEQERRLFVSYKRAELPVVYEYVLVGRTTSQ